jgi:hypothetical protein
LNDSRQSSQSIESNSMRGAIRSAGGYTSGYKGEKAVSMEHLQLNNYNSVDVRSSNFQSQMDSRNIDNNAAGGTNRVEIKELAFSKKSSSVKSNSDLGHSSSSSSNR